MLLMWIGVLALAGSCLGAKSSVIAGHCTCNGDRNATYTRYPNPCPRTCGNHRSAKSCRRASPEYGCECNRGYVLSPRGKCILLKDCPATKHCRRNETYVPCKLKCPNNYCPVDDRNVKIICDPPRPCRPGCICKRNHLRLSRSDDKCILASECPPVKCKRPNEVWNSCPSKCLAERCADIGKNQSNCGKPNSNCKPRCVCMEGFYRNASNICIPAKDCAKCPRNAVYKQCPYPCPNTCEYPGGVRRCLKSCLEYGCECKPGYVLSTRGKCVLLHECPAAKKCKVNETFAACNAKCPNNYCPVDDRRVQAVCDQPYPCSSGCVCKANHLSLRQDDKRCILASDCPPVDCKRPNEEWNSCPSKCFSERCEDIGKNQTDCNMPYFYCEPQCVCKKGFYRNGSDICIPEKDCTKCPSNAVHKECPNPCPGTCEYPSGIRPCSRSCVEYGCECKSGFVLSANGRCILLQECPAAKNCKKNETFVACRVKCPNNYCPVDDTRAIVPCDPPYPCSSGCVCKANHLSLNQADDRCILASDCPPVKCKRPNEEWKPCPPKCFAERCEDIGKNQTDCNKPYFYCEPQCVCKKGFYRNGSDICIPAKDCTKCPSNGIYKKCPNPCPGTCEYPSGNRPCTRLCVEYGCECKPGYVLSTDGRCILLQECPDKCPNDYCPVGAIKAEIACEQPDWCSSGCVCKANHLCYVAKSCKKNETFVACKVGCPSNYCPKDDSRAKVACSPPYPCPAGCVCQVNHLSYNVTDNRCILASECPPVNCTRPNEEWNSCPFNCLAERCEDIGKSQTDCPRSHPYCEPQCVCKQGFYRNNNDICIPAIDCPGQCPISLECRRTCAVPNPPNCRYTPPPSENVDGCQCKEGYILSEKEGKCIEVEACPDNLGCNKDQNAVVKKCPQPCPSTCDAPDAHPCKKKCLPVGCECKPGYILSEIDGKCIQPTTCKGGHPCGPNGTFVQCRSGCPNDYCPVNDNRGIIICEFFPFSPCYSGCICKINHKRKSSQDRRCIMSSDCPPVNCTRQNEVWSSCPSACLAESCSDMDSQPVVCNTLLLNCEPRCVCAKNHFRNDSGICVSAKECPKKPPQPECGFNEVPSDCKIVCPPQTCESIFSSYQCENNTKCSAGCDCLDQHLRNKSGICVPSDQCSTGKTCPICKECRPTCAVPNPPNCLVAAPSFTNEDGCQCQSGFILSDSNGTCFKIEDCPENPGCNHDPHAVVKSCPWACPATCASPKTIRCEKPCLSAGCQCEPGYILSKENGTCILPEKCPCGNPCGHNGTFSDCGFRCLNQYCPQDDSLLRYACKPGRPCPPGCLCKENYRRVSSEDDTCVLASDCPPVNCTRPNEVWNPCSQCLAERCENINSPVLCDDPPGTNCDPRCVCIKGYYRDENDMCVPKKKCKKRGTIDN